MKLSRITIGIFLFLIFLFLPSLMNLSAYVFHTLNMVAIYVIAVTGLNILMGYTGQISIGHAAFFGIGAYTSAIVAMKLGFPFVLLLTIGGCSAALVGFFVGIACLRLKEVYLAMATIALAGVVQVMIVNWSSLTGGSIGLLGIPYFNVGFTKLDNPEKQFFLIVPLTFLLLVTAALVVNSRIGRAFKAIREDSLAASCYGIDATWYKLLSFTISAFYGGVGGSLFAHSGGILFPDHFGIDISVLFLMMLVLGGRGSIAGGVIGAALMTIGFELLRGLKEYQMILYGLILVVFILFMPQGIVGALGGLKERMVHYLKTIKRGGAPRVLQH